ncbi:MAG: LamG domain-containing protein [Lentisphaerae bacterium]|nr:LamG domain-containing protein [Lentisphaerota bacterium]
MKSFKWAALLGTFCLTTALNLAAEELTLSGAPNAAAPDNAWSFPAPKGSIKVSNIPDWGKDGFTLEVWCQPASNNCGYAVLMPYSIGFPNFNNEKFVFRYTINQAGKTVSSRIFWNTQPGEYAYFAYTGDAQSGLSYVNGKLLRTDKGNGIPQYNAKNVLHIGYNGNWSKPFQGRIGVVRLHKRVLTADEIKNNYQALQKNRPLTAGDAVIYAEDRRITGDFQKLDNSTRASAGQVATDGMVQFTVMPEKLTDGTLLQWGDFLTLSTRVDGSVIIKFGREKFTVPQVLRQEVTTTLTFVNSSKGSALFADGQFTGKLFKNVQLPATADLTFGGGFTGTIGKVSQEKNTLLPDDIGQTVTVTLDNKNVDKIIYPPNRHQKNHKEMFPSLIDFDDLTGWTMTYTNGAVKPVITRSKEKTMFSDYVLRAEFNQGDFPGNDAFVKIAPPQPIKINEPFDTLAIWKFAPGLTKPYPELRYSIQLRDADGKIHSIGMARFLEPGWGIHMTPLQEVIKTPAEIVSITFTGFNQKQTVAYFDSLHTYMKPVNALPDARVPSWEEIGLPTRPETILPTATEKGTVTLKATGSAEWQFESVTPSGKKLIYTIKPASGALSDITASYNGKTFKPMDGGGFYWAENNIYPVRARFLIPPTSARVQAKLNKAEIKGKTLYLDWTYTIDKRHHYQASWQLDVIDNTLIADLKADPMVGEFKFGAITGISGKVVQVPYLVWGSWAHRSDPPGIFAADDVYVSAYIDWYNSDASGLFGQSSSTPGGKWFLNPATSDHRWMPDPDVKDPTNVIRDVSIINGGSYYWPTTAGKRNPARERIMVTVSDNLAAILPNIPNYKHKYLEETINDVWCTRMWYVNKMPDLDHFDREYEMWEAFKAYGADEINIRLHGDVSRQYVPHRDGGPSTFIEELVDPDLGGDAKLAELFSKMQKLGFRTGIYTDHMLLNVFSPAWDLNNLNLDSNGYWIYSSGNTKQTKISRMVALQKKYNAIYRRKFAPNCAYLDQITCPPCWRYTDYDARTPDAAKFSAPFRVFVESLRTEEADFGPVLSEGRTQIFWAGLCDSYAQPQHGDLNLLPDFNLRKIHTLTNDCGYDLNLVAKSARRSGIEQYCYELLAYEYAYGSTGHLIGNYSGEPFKELPPALLRSYFLIQPAQKHYAQVPIKDIFYNVNGKLDTVEAAIKHGTLATNQIKLVYENGLEVAVNQNKTENFAVTLNGKKYLLPPRGFAACLPGKVEAFSVLNSAGERSDLMREGNLIYAVNPQDIDEIKAKHDYALRYKGQIIELTPTPFVAAETVSIKVPFAGTAQVDTFDRKGNKLGSFTAAVKDGRIELNVDGKAFRYNISK